MPCSTSSGLPLFGCCGTPALTGMVYHSNYWSTNPDSEPPDSYFGDTINCLLPLPYENEGVKTLAQYNGKNVAVEPLCSYFQRVMVTAAFTVAYIRREKGTGQSNPTPAKRYTRACTVQKLQFNNPARNTMVVWRYRGRTTGETRPPPEVLEHISCRLTADPVIELIPDLADSNWPQDGNQSVEVIYTRLMTVAEASTVGAPFPLSCLAP